MIELTRLNGNKFFVNGDLIKYVEAAPDTTLTLVTGEKLLVIESREVVAERTLFSRAEVFRNAWPDGVSAMSAKLAVDAVAGPANKGPATKENGTLSNDAETTNSDRT